MAAVSMATVMMAGVVPMNTLCGDRLRLFFFGAAGLVVFFSAGAGPGDVPCGAGASGGCFVTFFLFSLFFWFGAAATRFPTR